MACATHVSAALKSSPCTCTSLYPTIRDSNYASLVGFVCFCRACWCCMFRVVHRPAAVRSRGGIFSRPNSIPTRTTLVYICCVKLVAHILSSVFLKRNSDIYQHAGTAYASRLSDKAGKPTHQPKIWQGNGHESKQRRCAILGT